MGRVEEITGWVDGVVEGKNPEELRSLYGRSERRTLKGGKRSTGQRMIGTARYNRQRDRGDLHP